MVQQAIGPAASSCAGRVCEPDFYLDVDAAHRPADITLFPLPPKCPQICLSWNSPRAPRTTYPKRAGSVVWCLIDQKDDMGLGDLREVRRAVDRLFARDFIQARGKTFLKFSRPAAHKVGYGMIMNQSIATRCGP